MIPYRVDSHRGCFSPRAHRGSTSARVACCLLLVVCLSLLTGCIGDGGTVVIRQLPAGVHDTQLLDAFRNQSVTTILLASDYAVGSQFDKYAGPYQEGSPIIPVNRNITITGLADVDPTPMLDFQFKLAVVQLCHKCWLNLVNISVTDERMGANAQFDFFLGEGSSVITATNVYRNRKACTDIEAASKLVERTSRSSRFLGPQGTTRQIYEAADVVWRGQLFPRTLHLLNYSAEFPKHYNGGYIVVLNNVWRMCHSFVESSCLLEMDPDMCVFQAFQRLLHGQQQQQDRNPALSAGVTAGIVIGVVVFVLMVAAIGALVYYRRRRQQGRKYGSPKKQLALPDVETGICVTPAQSCHVMSLRDSHYRDLKDPSCEGLRSSPKPGGGGGGGGSGGARCALAADSYSTSPPNTGVQAGYLSRSHPQLPGSLATLKGSLCSEIADLRFGALLGTGSFGRVYKGRLGDCDVAIKVIEHDSRMSASVDNEVALMLSCQHPNVVCAYHYVTLSHGQDQSSSQPFLARDTGSRSSNTQPSSSLEPAAAQTAQQPSDVGSAGNLSHGSNNSMDKPIPVLPGPKFARQSCPACDREVWPSHADECLTLSSSTAAPPFSSKSSCSSSGAGAGGVGGSMSEARHSTQGSRDLSTPPKCTCSCSSVAQPQSGLLNWQHEGGFWPAGPSALIEQQEEFPDEEPDKMVTTLLIQEYCDSGTLGKQASSWGPATEDDKQMIKRLLLLQDVVKGLSYLHGKNVVHGDLNARNVLVTTNPASPCGLTAKLADLGLSRTIKQHKTHHTTCTVGTMSHMPPELLRHGHMSPAVDVYAFGIMMWEVYTREIAFRELHYGQFFEMVVLRSQRPRAAPGMPEDYRVLMEHCWATEPSERPTTKALLECLGLMIAERQHSLGLRVTSSVDSVDREYCKQHGLSDGFATQQLAGQRVKEVELQQRRQQQMLERHPTPARLPPHLQQQQYQQHAGSQWQELHQYRQGSSGHVGACGGSASQSWSTPQAAGGADRASSHMGVSPAAAMHGVSGERGLSSSPTFVRDL